jgi:hypothetical protein
MRAQGNGVGFHQNDFVVNPPGLFSGFLKRIAMQIFPGRHLFAPFLNEKRLKLRQNMRKGYLNRKPMPFANGVLFC